MFKVLLAIGDKNYKGKGKTAFEALSDLPLDFTQVKTKGVITISKGKKKAEKLFYLRPLRMLFANHLRRKGFAWQLEALLNKWKHKDHTKVGNVNMKMKPAMGKMPKDMPKKHMMFDKGKKMK